MLRQGALPFQNETVSPPFLCHSLQHCPKLKLLPTILHFKSYLRSLSFVRRRRLVWFSPLPAPAYSATEKGEINSFVVKLQENFFSQYLEFFVHCKTRLGWSSWLFTLLFHHSRRFTVRLWSLFVLLQKSLLFRLENHKISLYRKTLLNYKAEICLLGNVWNKFYCFYLD